MKSLAIVALLIVGILLQGFTITAAQSTMTLYPVADGYPDNKYPNSAYGKMPFLYVGNSYDHVQDIWGSERIYIRFDLKDLPENQQILKGTLQLWQYYAPATNQTYETHRVLGDWNEATLDWKNQPPYATKKTSEAVAPPRTETTVEWDITRDVQAWYRGEAPNYGTMIKAAIEQDAKDASSGFWSREYPAGSHDEWRPKLILLLQPSPTSGYTVSVAVTGVPSAQQVKLNVDGKSQGTITREAYATLTFDKGTRHTVAVSEVLQGAPGTRYVCGNNQTQVSNATLLVFSYFVEYLATFSAEPKGMFEIPTTAWYRANTTLHLRRTGPDTIVIASGTRLVFEGWYLDSQRLAGEPDKVVVNKPFNLEGRYRTEYYLNVTSPIGNTTGSGWYTKDSVATFSVDRTVFPEPGVLGVLGLRLLFDKWVGTQNFLGVPVEPQGSVRMGEPAEITAVWREDWNVITLNFILLVLAILACVIAAKKLARKSRASSP
jgi:hypothetical protein